MSAAAATAAAPSRYRSKTLATWIAVVGGAFGLHRFYLHGLADRWGWLFIPPTLAGLYGVRRMREFGVDDHLAWALIPLLGFALAAAMITAIVHGLTPDERWNARYNPSGPQHRTGWATEFTKQVATFNSGAPKRLSTGCTRRASVLWRRLACTAVAAAATRMFSGTCLASASATISA